MRKAFYVTHKSYYFEKCNDDGLEIMIGDYPEGGGTTGEFCIRWCDLGGNLVPQLRAYDDSWRVLSEMQDLLQLLAYNDDKCITPDGLIKELLALKYVDLTSYSKEGIR